MGRRGLEVGGAAADGRATEGWGVHGRGADGRAVHGRGVGVVLVIGDDRGHRAHAVHGDRSGAEDLRYGPGQVEDGRGDVLGARPVVEINGNRLTQLFLRRVDRNGRRVAVPVGAG